MTEEYLADMVKCVNVPYDTSIFMAKDVPNNEETNLPQMKDLFESLEVADQLPESILIDSVGLFLTRDVVITSYVKRQLRFVIDSLNYLSNHWPGSRGCNKIRYLQGVSGMGEIGHT